MKLAIAVALLPLGLWGAGLTASAGTGVPSPAGIAVPPLPVPLPTPTPLPSPSLPGLGGTPSPTLLPGGGLLPGTGTVPGAAPVSPPAPPLAAPPATAPAAGGAAAGTPAAGTAGVGAPAWADSLLVHLNVSDPWLGAQVGAIVAHPVAAQPPDLRHLAFMTAGPPAMPGGGSGRAAAGLAAARAGLPAPALILFAAVILAALSAGLWAVRGRVGSWLPGWAELRRGHRRGTRARAVAAVMVPLVALTAGVLGVHQLSQPTPAALTGSHQRVTVPVGTIAALQIQSRAASTDPPAAGPVAAAPPPGAAGPPAPLLPVPRATTVSPAPPAVLVELRRVEESIAAAHTRLATAESRVAQLAAAPPSLRNQTGQVRSLRAAVSERDGALAAYNATLASEYGFYRSAAGDSARSTALVAAVQALGRPDLLDSVVYDLQVVRTQLAEEAALTSLAGSSPETGAVVSVVSGPATGLQLPLSGVLTQGFGATTFGLEEPRVYQGVFYSHFHTGLDLAAPRDTPVGAGAPGVVVFAGQSLDSAGRLVGYGNYVVVAHAHGYQTLYGHLDRLLVGLGQVVTAGQPLGLEGSTGWSTGPHTHFELRHRGEVVDPMPFLTGRTLS